MSTALVAEQASVPLPVVRAIRYVEPLREGGSLPGLMEADDLGTYVVKYIGAGQGTPSLVAEVIVGELGRYLGINVPRMTLVDLDEAFGRREPDPEIQHLLLDSVGVNLGVDYLPRALAYTGTEKIDAAAAAAIVWLDGLTVNVDRSWRNPNLLVWHGALWAIDHGAALLFQHSWPDVETFAHRPYPLDDHVLASYSTGLRAADAEMQSKIAPTVLHDIVGMVPDTWFPRPPGVDDVSVVRDRYVDYLAARAEAASTWLSEAGQ